MTNPDPSTDPTTVKIGVITADQLANGIGNPNASLTDGSFNTQGDIQTLTGDLALVVQSAANAKAFIQNRQWSLLWRDADLLYQSPRPMSVYENTYVLEPNVQRFTVAKVCNAVVPQLYKGLFYDDPPMILRPMPGTSQVITDAKTILFSYIMRDCNFKTQTKWGLETMAHLGTGIWKWGYNWKQVEYRTRKASKVTLGEGATATEVPTDEPPDITVRTKSVPLPFFEYRPLDRVLVDPQLAVGDIREAGWVIDVRYMDFYQMQELCRSVRGAIKEGENGTAIGGWNFPTEEVMKTWWATTSAVANTLETEQSSYIEGVVHHAQKVNIKVSPDPLRTKFEVLEYVDKGRKIIVFNQKVVIFKGDNEFKQINFFSANWWNRPKAF